MRGEDANGNGVLDPGEDWDGDGKLDPVEEALPPTIDTNSDGKPDKWADVDGDGKPDKFRDLDGDGIRDGRNVENVFVSLFQGRGFPIIDLSMIGLLCAMVAISGNGGLTNTSTSGYTRDQGWGMGYHVGAIPSVVGGHELKLSHTGSVFPITAESVARWKHWVRHVLRDQWVIWMPGCFVGLGLPSMLSVEFLPRGGEFENWTAAAMTAGYVGDRAESIHGPMAGQFFWFMTMFCGFLVLAPSVTSTSDGVIRRWVDVFWTASRTLQKIDPKHIGRLYFGVLCMYAVFGVVVLLFIPGGNLILIATNIYNFALGFSCFHTLVINCVLLPRELRPGWFARIGLLLAGTFFMLIAGLTIYGTLLERGLV
ncbi:MAG: Nramp family divalent metal transporter [Planctomycetes bacterium]|nr:Nramp family divalent metal transporter [Planctomycetota bacterium]